MNRKISIGLLGCVIAGHPFAIASESFDPEAEMAKLLGRFAKRTSVITTPPRNGVVYNSDRLLSPGFMKAIQAQEKIMKDLEIKDAEIAMLKEKILEQEKTITKQLKEINTLHQILSNVQNALIGK